MGSRVSVDAVLGSAHDALADHLLRAGMPCALSQHRMVVDWLWARRPAGRVWSIGVSGPQGAGKSTLSRSIAVALEAASLRTACVSLDDFYLTRKDQLALAARHPDNRYLEHRGYPGTHDLELGTRTLGALRGCESGSVEIPRYDKAAYGGRGDRGVSETLSTPIDAVVLEGWFLGFEPRASMTDPDLAHVDRMLSEYQPWWATLDQLVLLVPPDLETIVGWRVGAEQRRAAAGEAALTDEQARDYIERFLPAYRSYLGPLCERCERSDQVLMLPLRADRSWPHA